MAGTQLDVRLLGRFSVRLAGKEIPRSDFQGRLARSLVRILLTRRGELVTREYLTECLWPGRAPADPERNLNVMIARARRALRDASLIVTESGGYSFRTAAHCVVDAEVFLERVDAGTDKLKQGRYGDALRDFRTALHLWAGDPLAEDTYEDWAQDYRRKLASAYLQALEGGASAAVSVGFALDAASMARTSASREPFREASHLLLARSLAAGGDTAGALEVLRNFSQTLAQELGVDPPLAVENLEHELLHGDVAAVESTSAAAYRSTPPELAFLGRNTELQTIVDSVGGSAHGTVLLSGPPGSGKTRLLLESNRALLRPVVYGRAFSAEREEAWSLAGNLLQEAVALFPDVLLALPSRMAKALTEAIPQIQSESADQGDRIDLQSLRALAIEGATRLLELAADAGAALVVDDVQWCDPTSVSVLSRLCSRANTLPLVLAYRPNELEEPISSLLEEAGRRAVARVELGPLSPSVITQFFVEPELGRAVAEETDGTPLALAELIRALAAQGTLKPEAGNRWSGRAGDAEEQVRRAASGGRLRSILSRVQAVPPAAKQVLQLLALLGRPATSRLLADATRSDEVVVLENLELLERRSLVRLGNEGWVPVHDLIADAVSEKLPREQRGLLHAHLARALDDGGSDRSEVARHLTSAGDKLAAAQAFADAGEAALDRYESEEAEDLANSGLRLDPDAASKARLLEVRAEAGARQGHLTEARKDLRAALAGKETGPQRSLVLSRLALLISGAEDYARARELTEVALTEAGADLPSRARALTVRTMVEGNLGNLERAHSLAEEALELFRRLEDAHGAADVLELQGLNLLYAGRLIDGAELLGRVADLFRDAGKLLRIGPAVSMRCLALRAMQRLDQALLEIEEAVELEQQLGNPGGESWCRSARSLLLSDVGRREEAMREVEEALRIAEALGHRELKCSALLNLGFALQEEGRPHEAMAVWERCAEQAAGLPAFLSFASSAMALVEVGRGNLPAADAYLQTALDSDFPFAGYSAQLVQAELLVARRAPQAADRIAEYLSAAESQSCWQTIPRLRELLAAAQVFAPSVYIRTQSVVT